MEFLALAAFLLVTMYILISSYNTKPVDGAPTVDRENIERAMIDRSTKIDKAKMEAERRRPPSIMTKSMRRLQQIMGKNFSPSIHLQIKNNVDREAARRINQEREFDGQAKFKPKSIRYDYTRKKSPKVVPDEN